MFPLFVLGTLLVAVAPAFVSQRQPQSTHIMALVRSDKEHDDDAWYRSVSDYVGGLHGGK